MGFYRSRIGGFAAVFCCIALAGCTGGLSVLKYDYKPSLNGIYEPIRTECPSLASLDFHSASNIVGTPEGHYIAALNFASGPTIVYDFPPDFNDPQCIQLSDKIGKVFIGENSQHILLSKFGGLHVHAKESNEVHALISPTRMGASFLRGMPSHYGMTVNDQLISVDYPTQSQLDVMDEENLIWNTAIPTTDSSCYVGPTDYTIDRLVRQRSSGQFLMIKQCSGSVHLLESSNLKSWRIKKDESRELRKLLPFPRLQDSFPVKVIEATNNDAYAVVVQNVATVIGKPIPGIPASCKALVGLERGFQVATGCFLREVVAMHDDVFMLLDKTGQIRELKVGDRTPVKVGQPLPRSCMNVKASSNQKKQMLVLCTSKVDNKPFKRNAKFYYTTNGGKTWNAY